MEHIEALRSSGHNISNKFLNNSTGKFYTHFDIGSHITNALVTAIAERRIADKKIKVADPFAGDGRLIEWLINKWVEGDMPAVEWDVELWDINAEGLSIAEEKMQSLVQKGIVLNYTTRTADAFKLSQTRQEAFDIVITNPPWELLKPDTRHLNELQDEFREEYINAVRKYDSFLSSHFPKAQPKRKFAGWGTNLSRVGLELSHLICKQDGFIAIVIPASFFADDQSLALRTEILKQNELIDIAFFPAEARLFAKADVNSATFVYRKTLPANTALRISLYNNEVKITSSDYFPPDGGLGGLAGNIIPISLTPDAIKVLNKITTDMPTWEDLETEEENGLWAGRELDETGRLNWLSDQGIGPKFMKGAMIDRYAITQTPVQYVNKANWTAPPSCEFERIAWRDVSRSSQKRRMIATLIPGNTVAGNSLNVAYFRDGDPSALRILLSIMNSLCFEFQLRSHLATGHISLTSIRKVCVPSKKGLLSYTILQNAVESVLKNEWIAEYTIEAIVAREVYHLSENEFDLVISTFQKITEEERQIMLAEYRKIGN
ncbi:MAG: Alw26I/Eco31I/Esp3I family type II restriction adenine-specific DNA-methyltransferase [Chitinophagaceae bacterium]|nr:Alw26I/Eco31I/Esp3I family type II restriction adenine-specific DNA-methyltransferase [Chitinophagaceae bacterium]